MKTYTVVMLDNDSRDLKIVIDVIPNVPEHVYEGGPIDRSVIAVFEGDLHDKLVFPKTPARLIR